MTFGDHIVYLWPDWHNLRPSGAGANDATRDINKLHARQKSCDYHYYQYTRPNLINLFQKERNHVAGCKFLLHPPLCSFARERFIEGSLSFGRG